MEIAEQRRDGIWEVTPPAPHHPGLAIDDGFTAERPRFVGWSLAIVAGSNLGLVAIVLLMGMSPIGLAASAIFGLLSWMLVVAEILSVRRFPDH